MKTGETMGQRLVDLRKKARLSQRQLAREVGVPVATLRNWEHDRRVPGLMVGARLAKALGVSVEQLVANLVVGTKEELRQRRKRK